ncbi:MAG: primosomal protein DnaI [Haloplasmataceae bacterium]|jgi:primosomal protein DnaI|nr:primosomal protein DnaI [Haloplasmataceae bacterium]
MKELSNLINKDLNISSKVDKIKQDILRDKNLLNDLNEYNIKLTEEKLNNSLINLITFSENNRKCLNCPGLEACTQENKGYRPILKDANNHVNLQYTACDHQKAFVAQQSLANNLRSFYMPKKILNASINDIDLNDPSRVSIITKLLTFAKTYNGTTFQKGYYIYGNFGVGKTYLLAAMANELAKRNIKVAFVYLPDLIRELKSAIGTHNLESMMSEIKKIQVLILDDIGSEMSTQWVRDEIIGSILQYRMLDELPTFFSSNKSVDELIKFYSITNDNVKDEIKAERIGDRIKALTNEVKVMGKNYRY